MEDKDIPTPNDDCSPTSVALDRGLSGGGWNGRLRPRTPSQFPQQLAALSGELQSVDSRLDRVRRGRGLFTLVHDEELAKEAVESEAANLELNAHKNEWREAAILSATSLEGLEGEGGETYPWEDANGEIGGGTSDPSSTQNLTKQWAYIYMYLL